MGRNEHLFKTKPIGPLGRHIKLTQDANKNDGLNTLLEIQLGIKNLRSFLVSCNEDRLVLEKMMQKQWTSRTRQPMITFEKDMVVFMIFPLAESHIQPV